MFSDKEEPALVEDAIAAGVCSYNLSGVSDRDMKAIVASAVAHFRRYARVETELAAATAQLEERRIIERAKALLMAKRKITEPQAYRWLRNKAMNDNRRIAEVAADVIKDQDAGALDDSARTPSNASRSGSPMSNMTRSGASRRTASTRSAPPATRATFENPAPPSLCSSKCARSESKSTTKIFSDMNDRSHRATSTVNSPPSGFQRIANVDRASRQPLRLTRWPRGWSLTATVQVFGRRHHEGCHALRRPASKKRQGTKSREAGQRLGGERYGDFRLAAP